MQALKSLFKKKTEPKNPEDLSSFDHSKLAQSDDMSQCPFMKNKNQAQVKTEQTSKQQKCPYNGKKEKKGKKADNKQAETSSDEEQVPRGGCPFMGGSEKKRNPDLIQINNGYDEPFVSKFNYYLSSKKIDFSLLRSKKGYQPTTKSRQIFNTYPIYLQHTLFYSGEDYKKVRQIQCCSRFMPYQTLRQKGNKYFNKGRYAEALDYYERSLSLFKWLELCDEQEKITKQQNSMNQSQISLDSENMSMQNQPNIRINLKNQQEQLNQKQGQLDEMTSQYKEFFIVYNDSNVKLCDGQEMTELPDIDMRKSLMLQVYLNMAATYIHLHNYKVALECIEDCFSLSDKISQVYLRKAQILVSMQSATIEELYQARKCMQTGIQLKKTQKIFQSNENILKMVNLHNANQYYERTLNLVLQKINTKQAQMKQIKQKIYDRTLEIYEVEQRLISQGKTPYEQNEQPMLESHEYKILMRMKQKYIKVIQFYTQAQNKQQIRLAKQQLQQLLRVFSHMTMILSCQVEQKESELGGIQTQKIQRRIQTIKKGYCEDVYNSGKFNFSVLQWAIKEIIKEDQQKAILNKKRQQQERALNGEVNVDKKGFSSIVKKASFILVLLPVVGLVVNNFFL